MTVTRPAPASPARQWLTDPTTRWALPLTGVSAAAPLLVYLTQGTGLLLRCLAVACAIVLILGVVILIDRWRAPRRSLHKLATITSERDLRDAAYQVDRLIALGDWRRAHTSTVAICVWLDNELRASSPRRQRRLSAMLDTWTARRAEYNPAAEFTAP